MQIYYKYKGKLFSSMKDILDNNLLTPDFDYIMNELIPFQGFISGRTFFKEITIEPSFWYDPKNQINDFNFDKEFFSNGIDSYLYRKGFDKTKKIVAAVSGGVDSSCVAMEVKPDIIYSGYYEGDEFFNETPYSSAIAKAIDAHHIIFKLTEDDFLNNLDEYMGVIGSPVGGLGGVMEFSMIKKILKELNVNTDVFVFGNGGDEIFMGYYFNYFVKDFWEYGHREISKYMSNFLPTKVVITEDVIDFMLVASLNRASVDVLHSPFVVDKFLPVLRSLDSILDKLLYININYTLPTLLHVYAQFADYFKIKCFNPLSNVDFIKGARKINTPMSEIPKNALREIHRDMPDIVKKNYLKRGFPIPIHTWTKLNKLMNEVYDSFFDRPYVNIPKKPYTGITRYSWAIFQIELFLRKYGAKGL